MAQGTKNGGLKSLMNQVADLEKQGVLVFPLGGQLESEALLWNGEFDAFIAFAQKLGQKVLYVHEGRVDADDTHEGETAWVDVAFLHAGYFHAYRDVAPWAREYLAETGESDESLEDNAKRVLDELEAREPELLRRFMESLDEDSEPIDPKNAGHAFRSLVGEELGLDGRVELFELREVSPELQRKLEQLGRTAEKVSRERENKLVGALLSPCTDWARENALNKPTQGDIQVFLSEHGTTLSRDGARQLWQKVNFALKSGRIPA